MIPGLAQWVKDLVLPQAAAWVVQMQLQSGVAVAVAQVGSSYSTSSPGTSIRYR